MRFGLQKLTLLDYHGKVACTVFTEQCNLRCPFCHNADLVMSTADELPLGRDEIISYLRSRSKVLDGVCVTGGEPLLHGELPAFMGRVRELGFAVKLDTNGSFPDRLQEILSAGLADYVAMDIKNAPAKYAETAGLTTALPLVERSVEILKGSGIPYEFRTTVTGNLHEPEDFTAIGKWICGTERYFLQAFLDSGEVLKADAGYPVSREKLQACLLAVQKYIPQAAVRGAA